MRITGGDSPLPLPDLPPAMPTAVPFEDQRAGATVQEEWPQDLDATQIEWIILLQAPEASPLRAQAAAIAETMVEISARTGVPAWLMLCQMRFENNLGNPQDGLIKPREIHASDGSVVDQGPSHNLFGFAGMHPTTGRHVRVYPAGPDQPPLLFQAYGSFTQSIAAFGYTIDSADRGLTLEQYVQKYFPIEQNGPERFAQYMQSIIDAARQWAGVALRADSIVVPPRSGLTPDDMIEFAGRL